MALLFYISAGVATAATVMVISRTNAVHALLYLIVSLLAVALAMFALGAPFVAALEVIVYAGAVMVLFIFVIMMLNLGGGAAAGERQWLRPRTWAGPALLAAILLGELIAFIVRADGGAMGRTTVEPQQVGATLFGPYLLGVELASMLLLAGLVGAYHLARPPRPGEPIGRDEP